LLEQIISISPLIHPSILIQNIYTHNLPKHDQLMQKEIVLFCIQLAYHSPIDISSLHCRITRRRNYIKI